MKTDVYELMFETLKKAQEILSKNDPGYTLYMGTQNKYIILNDKDKVVMIYTVESVSFFDVGI